MNAVNPIPSIIPLYIMKTIPNFSGCVPALENKNKAIPIHRKTVPTPIENFAAFLNLRYDTNCVNLFKVLKFYEGMQIFMPRLGGFYFY